MNSVHRSEAIKAGLRKGFENGSSKMAHRKCYGYDITSDGALAVNNEEAKVVIWIFEQYRVGKSLGKIAAGLEQQGILSPSGKMRWNREAIDKLLSNEKYTGRVLLQKTFSTGISQIEMMASWNSTFTLITTKPLFQMNYLKQCSRRECAAQNLLIKDFP